jgi:4'-phosphopantetheinyl transferase EntD
MRLPLETLRQLLACPSLEVHVDESWRSSVAPAAAQAARHALRQALVAALKTSGTRLAPSNEASLLDLSTLPSTEDLSVSISHCPELGGFSWVKKPWTIGFDIEVIARVSKAAAARMSKPDEIAQAPSPWQLWVAKEAAFKAFRGPQQPAALSGIETSQWRSHSAQSETPKFWTFSAKCLNPKQDAPSHTPGHGVVCESSGQGFGIFILPLN